MPSEDKEPLNKKGKVAVKQSTPIKKYENEDSRKRRKKNKLRGKKGLAPLSNEPSNIFPVSKPEPYSPSSSAQAPIPESEAPVMARNSKHGKEDSHFDKRLAQRTMDEREAKEVLHRLEEGIRRDGLHEKWPYEPNPHATAPHTYITHKFPTRRGIDAPHKVENMLVSHVKNETHDDFGGDSGPVATTIHGTTDKGLEGFKSKGHVIRDASDIEVPDDEEPVDMSKAFDAAWELLKSRRE
tara:strand:+ start:1456 stop:2175 length:720 start_codon:yes stop_codon:yes gene_type:complete